MLGYIPLSSKEEGDRLDELTKIIICLAFVAGVICHRPHSTVGRFRSIIQRVGQLPKDVCVSLFLFMGGPSKLLRRVRNSFPMNHEGSGEITSDRTGGRLVDTHRLLHPPASHSRSDPQATPRQRSQDSHLPSQPLSKRTLCFVKAAGWKLSP